MGSKVVLTFIVWKNYKQNIVTHTQNNMIQIWNDTRVSKLAESSFLGQPCLKNSTKCGSRCKLMCFTEKLYIVIVMLSSLEG